MPCAPLQWSGTGSAVPMVTVSSDVITGLTLLGDKMSLLILIANRVYYGSGVRLSPSISVLTAHN